MEAIVKKSLPKEFEIKDLGALKYFLSTEVARSKHGIFISQRKYILDLLQETGMLGCKSNDTPIDPNLKLDEDLNGTLVDKGSYHRLVGKLIYLSYTRLDIAYVVSLVRNNRLHIEAYTNSDYGGSIIDRRSTSGYLYLCWG